MQGKSLNSVAAEFAKDETARFKEIRQMFLEALNGIKSAEGNKKSTAEGGVKASHKRAEIDLIQSFGVRKSVNEFNSSKIEKTKLLAETYYKQLGVKSPFFRA